MSNKKSGRPCKYSEAWYNENMTDDKSTGSHQCKRCGKYGDSELAFYANNKNPHICRYCWAEDGRKRREKNPDAEVSRVQQWRAKQK